MEPQTDQERAIAQAVDERFRQDPTISYASVVPDVAASLAFLMSPAESKFLVRYAQWRSDHPETPGP